MHRDRAPHCQGPGKRLLLTCATAQPYGLIEAKCRILVPHLGEEHSCGREEQPGAIACGQWPIRERLFCASEALLEMSANPPEYPKSGAHIGHALEFVPLQQPS